MECPLDDKKCYTKREKIEGSFEEGLVKCRHGEFWDLDWCPAYCGENKWRRITHGPRAGSVLKRSGQLLDEGRKLLKKIDEIKREKI